MILIMRSEDKTYANFICAADSKQEVKDDIKTLLQGICKDIELIEIFLEEFNNIAPIMEERIKDVQNSFSHSDREQDH